MLLDCSAPVPFRMAQERLDWPNLDAIWISHFHMDHCGGLGPFLAGTKHAIAMKGRTKPLRIFGPAGIKGLLDKLSDVNNYRLFEQPFPVEVKEIEELEKFDVLPGVGSAHGRHPLVHRPEAIDQRAGQPGHTLEIRH